MAGQLLPVAPETAHFGRSRGIATKAYLANDLTTKSSRELRRIGEVGLSKSDAANQFLEAQAQANENSPQAVQNRRLAQQLTTAKFQA
jgi:hypothetical protein